MSVHRYQKIAVIRRKSDGKFWKAPPKSYNPIWIDDVREASVFDPKKAVSRIRIDYGRNPDDFDILPVVPQLIDDGKDTP